MDLTSYTTNPQLIKPREFEPRATRSYPETVGDISRVTLNFDLSKIPFVRF